VRATGEPDPPEEPRATGKPAAPERPEAASKREAAGKLEIIGKREAAGKRGAATKPGTRAVILDAAARIMRERGLAATTTRQIAAAAGFSEATLYKHFADKVELMAAVLGERSTGFAQLAAALERKADTLAEGLAAIAAAAIAFYSDNFPMLASVFSDRTILAAHQDGLQRLGLGPHRVNEAVIGYLTAEREAGRVRADADVHAAAGLLLGGCLQHAFLGHMGGWPERRDDQESATAFGRTVAHAIEP
jgi:AcrR family transcriptional regulator